MAEDIIAIIKVHEIISLMKFCCFSKDLNFNSKLFSFDSRFLNWKNCSDLCVVLKMNDRLGGRRREGYLRGCLSDIIHYNQTLIALSTTNSCFVVKLRDLFISTEKFVFFFF
ncbi:hypothetical protein X798_05782 [Onchocerca flexuosa]|uniref:Uncharacterized protein n=1 Tax=Onchocerca flexuosa TaxID=387005 RepID=A0A238BQF4_9BILA|nr:hypothetical protein X798_05782 [Onchocerca flexuosa]